MIQEGVFYDENQTPRYSDRASGAFASRACGAQLCPPGD